MALEIIKKHRIIDGDIYITDSDIIEIEDFVNDREKGVINSNDDNDYNIKNNLNNFHIKVEISVEKEANFIQKIIGKDLEIEDFQFDVTLSFNPKTISQNEVLELVEKFVVKYYKFLLSIKKHRSRVMYKLSGFINKCFDKYFEEEMRYSRIKEKPCIEIRFAEICLPEKNVVTTTV